MKKFFLFCLIVAIVSFAGFVFYRGAINFQLAEGEYGVFLSKFAGYSEKIIAADLLVWRWEAALPWFSSLLIFPVGSRSVIIDGKGALPSAEVYRAYVNGSPDFSYHYQVHIAYRLKPERLPFMVSEQSLLPDGLTAWYAVFEDELRGELFNFFSNYNEDPLDNDNWSWDNRQLIEQLTIRLSDSFADVEFITIAPGQLRLADLRLYQSAYDEYFALMELRKEINSETMRQESQRIIKERLYLELLVEYGKLFEQYPLLIEALEKNIISKDELVSLPLPLGE